VQRDIDNYFSNIIDEDRKKNQLKRESKAKQKLRIVALKFYLNECLKLNISFKGFSTNGRTEVRPHRCFDKKTIEKLL
jgi:hypothetical protein